MKLIREARFCGGDSGRFAPLLGLFSEGEALVSFLFQLLVMGVVRSP